MFGRSWLVLAVFATACGSTPSPAADAGPGPGSGAGLSVSWRSTPSSFPANLGDNVTIRDVTFAADSLAIVGTAGPGDPRTTSKDFTLTWDDSGTPATMTFADAPSGQYSSVALVLDGHFVANALAIHGTYNGIPFVISDRRPYSVSLAIDRTLKAGGGLAIGVAIDFHDALGAIDWQNTPLDDGTHYEIESGDALQGFLDKLTSDIRIDSSVH